MSKPDWTVTVTNVEAYHRANGRRAYNRMRQIMAAHRLAALVGIVIELDFKRGWQSEAAKRPGWCFQLVPR